MHARRRSRLANVLQLWRRPGPRAPPLLLSHPHISSSAPPPSPQVRLGPLTPHAVRTLRHLREFFGVLFDMKADQASGTIILSCVGCGLKNLSRKIT